MSEKLGKHLLLSGELPEGQRDLVKELLEVCSGSPRDDVASALSNVIVVVIISNAPSEEQGIAFGGILTDAIKDSLRMNYQKRREVMQ